jgi:thioredoxin reductase
MLYDVVIVGGGPAGLSAALALGRARKRVLLCDAGPPRNAAATHMQNFVSRDGTPPPEFRRIAREQLARYPTVEIQDVRVEEIRGERGEFHVRLGTASVSARRILLCAGLVDELPAIEGFRELWGTSIVICPYCHGWEVQDQRFAYLAPTADRLSFALLLRSWTRDVIVLTGRQFEIPAEMADQLAAAHVPVDERPIARVRSTGGQLQGIEFADGEVLERDVLFAHPPQQPAPLVLALGLALDPRGFVQVDEMQRETSVPGIYAAGDLVTYAQSAILAAASGTQAAAMLNHSLTVELAVAGALT